MHGQKLVLWFREYTGSMSIKEQNYGLHSVSVNDWHLCCVRSVSNESEKLDGKSRGKGRGGERERGGR